MVRMPCGKKTQVQKKTRLQNRRVQRRREEVEEKIIFECSLKKTQPANPPLSNWTFYTTFISVLTGADAGVAHSRRPTSDEQGKGPFSVGDGGYGQLLLARTPTLCYPNFNPQGGTF